MNAAELKQYFRGDRIIWIIIIALTMASLLIVYSSTGALAYRQANGNTSFYFLRQFLFQGIGYIGILLMINYLPVRFYNKFANVFYLLALFFVCIGLVIGRGTGRTIPLGFFSFQPAEFAKVAVIIWVSRLLANCQEDKKLISFAFIKITIGVGIFCLLILFANFSSTVLLFGTVLIMMFIGRVPILYLGSVVLAGLLMVIIIYFASGSDLLHDVGRFPTIHGRLERWIFPPKVDSNGLTQDDFAKIAIHRGGFTGVGAGKSQISNFMPAAYNDFVYSIIIEEYGLFGGVIIALLYLILLTRSGTVIRKCNRSFPTFLATGAITIIVLQAMINMAVSSGAIPVTGQPLPWVSWGGTSQIFTAITFGLLLSVSSENDREKQKEVEENFNSEELTVNEDVELIQN